MKREPLITLSKMSALRGPNRRTADFAEEDERAEEPEALISLRKISALRSRKR